MPAPLLRRAVLLSLLLLLCITVESPAPARAAQGDPPKTMHGVYRYKVRGLSAGGGIFVGMMGAQALYAASVYRMFPGVLKLLAGMAKVSKDPSTAEVMDFLRSGTPGVDFSTIPISAGLDIEIEFTLEEVKKDEWQLKRGSYRWSSDANFRFSAGEGSIKESVRGQGSGTLDPKVSSISLITIGKKESRRSDLSGSIQMSGQGGGNSTITNGPVRISWDYSSDNVIMEIVLPGLAHHSERLGSGFWDRNFSFSKSGHPAEIEIGKETYQDLLDSHVVEEWQLWSECAAEIRSPVNNGDLVFDESKPGRLVDTAMALVTPTFWEDDLDWKFPEISGSDLEPPPIKSKGNDFYITYTNLPAENSAFKFGYVEAFFATDRAKGAGCKDPLWHEVGYFFPRQGVNHGGPAGLKTDNNPDKLRPNPNWFHYWMQTKANVGIPRAFVRYGGDCPGVHGYYPYTTNYIVICNLTSFEGYNPLQPWVNPKGIDYFAAVMLHEWQHYHNYLRFWAKHGNWIAELDRDPANRGTRRGKGELLPPHQFASGWEGDLLPDAEEPDVEVPREVRVPPGARFMPFMQDTFGYGLEDEHYLAYAAMLRWKIGSADSEDWSCPGKQGRTSKCQERQ